MSEFDTLRVRAVVDRVRAEMAEALLSAGWSEAVTVTPEVIELRQRVQQLQMQVDWQQSEIARLTGRVRELAAERGGVPLASLAEGIQRTIERVNLEMPSHVVAAVEADLKVDVALAADGMMLRSTGYADEESSTVRMRFAPLPPPIGLAADSLGATVKTLAAVAAILARRGGPATLAGELQDLMRSGSPPVDVLAGLAAAARRLRGLDGRIDPLLAEIEALATATGDIEARTEVMLSLATEALRRLSGEQ